MYDSPKLNCLGKSDEVILGIVSFGYDLDGLVVIDEMEFAEDLDTFDVSEPSRT